MIALSSIQSSARTLCYFAHYHLKNVWYKRGNSLTGWLYWEIISSNDARFGLKDANNESSTYVVFELLNDIANTTSAKFPGWIIHSHSV